MSKLLNYVATLLCATLLTALTVSAQTAQSVAVAETSRLNAVASDYKAGSPSSSPAQIVNSLINLPEADTLIYINPQRILNEVVPKFMSPKDVEEMRKDFEQAKAMAGVDPTKIEYVVLAIRFKKPTANLDFQPPELLAMASGDFSADSLVTLARVASQGKLRDETYGTKTLGLMTIDPLVKMAEKNPFLKSFSEVGVVSLSGNTIAAGSPAYLRAAIDAGQGKDRISPEMLNSLIRDPNALISIAGSPWHAFSKSFGMLGTEANARAPRCEMKLGDFYVALTMDATNFMVRGSANEDNPDTAKIVSRLFSMLFAGAMSSIKDPGGQSILKSLKITAEGDEIHLSADIPQQAVIEFIHQQMKKPTTGVDSQKEPVKVKTRRGRRRTHKM